MKYLISLFFCLFAVLANAQYDIEDAKKEEDKEAKKHVNFFELKQRIYVGGELALSLGTGGTYLYAAPLIGFDITEKFSAGLSGMYQLQRLRLNNGSVFNYNSFGGGVFTRLRPIEPLLMQVEYNLFNTSIYDTGPERVNVPAFMAGLGYAGAMGPQAYYQIMLMYDLIADPNMPLPGFIIPPLHLKFGFIWHLE
ncbi:hypothetical protein N8987_03945 [Crocinitomix sp.]|nr:hypothetical protein [Crocinitomix sp.]